LDKLEVTQVQLTVGNFLDTYNNLSIVHEKSEVSTRT
jgi:hypothetical protein